MSNLTVWIAIGVAIGLFWPHGGAWRLSRDAWRKIGEVAVMSLGFALFSAVSIAFGLLGAAAIAIAMGS